MSERRPLVPEETRRLQRDAGDPRASAWVAANAGSGKTWVLSRRVMRILLEGTAPSRILCLTFTKAAAATMSNRVFQELARWAVAEDAALARELEEVTGVPAGPGTLLGARRLFAAAIETPGGLKIQTIHAFCERILQQFPLEADLAGNFEILDEATTSELIAAARDEVLVRAASEPPDGRLARAFAVAIDRAGDTGFLTALDELVRRRDLFRETFRAGAGDDGAIAADIAAALGIAPDDTAEAVLAQAFPSPHFPGDYLSRLIDALRASSANDQKSAAALYEGVQTAEPAARLAAWHRAFHTKEGPPKTLGRFATKAICGRFADLDVRFDAECRRLADLAERRAAVAAAEASRALAVLGDAVLQTYADAKLARGALDFDDLIGRTADLLARSDAAAWVQYKLDRGIDHVLVDEAQDTSPRQWRIVRQLTEEFFAGRGQRDRLRTVFAVGDEKQSIYSFQGAAPGEFSRNQKHFQGLATGLPAGAPGSAFQDVKLKLSFRSTPDVLAAVDKVFEPPAMRRGVIAGEEWPTHAAIRAAEPGLVEIWPVVEKVSMPEPTEWSIPVDTIRAESPPLVLARRIRDEIARLLDDGTRLEGTGLPVRPKDILILVRKRGPFVEAMNRVLKERGIPVAGADRLVLTDHIAVEDLVALGRAVAMPEDDLSLAAVLKSPLVGWDDERLAAVAIGRERKTLAEALAEHAGTDPEAARVAELYAGWRRRADLTPPFEFYAHVLSAEGGRRRFVERLGPEAEDVIDEFLARAIDAGGAGAPSLAGFLAAMEAAPPEIKREMDEGRDEVRVMTVHGAKGLEAPVVFLVDTGAKPTTSTHEPKLLPLAVPGRTGEAAPALVWCPSKATRAAAVDAALARWKEEQEDEYRRLLYVAMTRAADRLYVTCHAGARTPDGDCWYRVVEAALRPDAEVVRDGDVEVALRWRSTGLPPVPARSGRATAAAPAAGEVPDWLARPAAASEAPAVLRPSSALAEMEAREGLPAYPAASALDAALAPESIEAARGRVMHKLLETLPGMDPATRRDAALAYASRALAGLDAAAARRLVDEVEAVVGGSDFAAAFAPGSRAEVAIVGTVTGRDGKPLAVSGQIDRLCVGAEGVLVVDYKTNRQPPAGVDGIPDGYVAQMAVYRRLLANLFPGRPVRCAILWTALPRLVEIPPERLDALQDRLAVA